MECHNSYNILAESPENPLQGDIIIDQIDRHTAEESANTKKQNGRRQDDATFPKVSVKPLATAVGGRPPAVSPANDPPRAVNWADVMDDQDASPNPNPFTVVSRKRRRTSVHPRSSPAQSDNVTQKSANSLYNKPPAKRPPLAQQIKATRQRIAQSRAQQSTITREQYVYLEHCQDFGRPQYLRALDKLIGGTNILQLARMNGHVLVGLSTKVHADRLIEDGLEIEETLLKAFPFRKRAEKVIISNLPLFVEDSEVMAALRPYGQITSIAPVFLTEGGFTFADSRREMFILLNEGMKLERLPLRLAIKSMGETLPAFLSYGVKCSRCQRQGHRRANCPLKTPAEVSGQAPSNVATPVTAPTGQPTSASPASSTVATAPAVTSGTIASTPSPAVAQKSAPQQDKTKFVQIEAISGKEDETQVSIPSRGGPKTRQQLKELLESIPNSPLEEAEHLGLDKDEELPMSFRLASINVRGLAARERSIELCHFLRQHRIDVAFVQETNTSSLDTIQDLCLGYLAAVVPPTAIRGSGLACIFAPGVAVLGQRILWPGHISIVSLDVHGQEVSVINCHLSHIPRERHQQLQIIAATAVQENSWVLGDLNINEESTNDTASGSVEALSELLDQTALVDVAILFDATHIPTRVASYGSRVDASRLDRILLPSSFSDRVVQYSTIHYRLSDHRAVLLQLGVPPSPRQPCVAAMLRSGLVVEHLATIIERTSTAIADMTGEDLWRSWSSIKTDLLAEVRSLNVPRVADDDHIVRARRFLQARLEAASTEADYPSLPNLGHTLRMCRPARTNFRDEEGNIIEGTELRRRVYSILQRRFASQSCDSNAATEFIQGTTTPLILEDDDPLLRSEISATEIATAIRRLPLGRAPGWDDLPCEFYMAYEDFFVNALKRVYEASQLAGVLPTSTRRSTICLVPKSHGGPGLCGYRPISLPTTDYRILGNVLLRRLRPHLPVLVPQCQTYAVPGRSPSWNISRVRDEVDAAVRTGSPLAVISTDLESAFDTLDRGFLVSLMVSLRLPQVFIGWFLLLYSGADATVRAGGLHTKPFQLLNGVRQGCAISAAMFSLATSPLLRRLEQALGPGNVLAYADDIVLLIRSEEQFGVVTSIFENFRRASGIKGNFTKSEGLWCGAWRARNDAPLGISWSSVELKVLGCNVTPGNQNSAQERHILVLLEAAITRWSPYTRGLSLVGRARAANSLVLSSVVHHIHGYLPTDRTIHKIQARLARFIWGPERTAWFPGSVLARPVSLGGFGLIDIETQLRLSCFKGVQAALRGNRNAYSWLVESDAWLYPPPSGSWLSPRRLRLLKIWEAVADIFTLDHSVLTPHQLLNLPIIGGCRLLRPPDLLAPTRWVNACIRDFAGPAPPLTRPTRCALADAASLTSFCRRLIDENLRGTYRVNTIGQAVVLRGTTTPFLRVITRTARRILERPRLTALPIIQFARRWEENINLPINIGWSSLRRCAFSGHNADVAVRLALHALPHPAHPASAHQSCIACGSGDLSLVHRYWSCRYIRPLIREAFTIIGRPPDLQGWVFGHGLDDDALAILASAKTRIYRHFLGAELRSVQEDPLLVWRRTLSSIMLIPAPPLLRGSFRLRLMSILDGNEVLWIVFDFYLLKKMDQRTCIKFCVKNEIKCADAFRMLTVAYGEATLDRSNVYWWYKMFSEGREDVNDEERAGRPSTSTTDEKINEVEKMILANRRITVREVAEDLNISIGSCHSIFINDLGMRRVAAKFVPKLLNCDQKQHRMNIANEMLDSVRDDPNLLQRVVTGYEAWVYGYDVETKAQSSQWKLPHEPRPKKARQVRSNVKVLLTVFFDCRGVVHHEFLPQGRTANKEYYLQVMRNLREAIRQKRPDLWKNKNWLLHHDNAPAHTSLLVRNFLAKNNTLMMPQPPYSPDLAPCDFFLFPKLKRPMKGRRYATLDEIKTASKEELKKIFFK
ncbi:hypothetical protein LAZ67_1008329 [Cordylochernes scorpioides]|uniref:Reverse transcriptase n=1 Tax=Cordylochernes scorpioides TaxID=51811 RepID=A0ABY6K4S9_9ARAC|nr:hypothetical protein LAZ67_1008329 [Cordylochernes scorpioides]